MLLLLLLTDCERVFILLCRPFVSHSVLFLIIQCQNWFLCYTARAYHHRVKENRYKYVCVSVKERERDKKKRRHAHWLLQQIDRFSKLRLCLLLFSCCWMFCSNGKLWTNEAFIGETERRKEKERGGKMDKEMAIEIFAMMQQQQLEKRKQTHSTAYGESSSSSSSPKRLHALTSTTIAVHCACICVCEFEKKKTDKCGQLYGKASIVLSSIII